MRFTNDHEWIRVDGDIATVGITDHAQGELGDIVFIELPDAGRALAKGDQVAVVESVKAASEVYAPIAGEVTETNDRLTDEPGLVNSDPMGDGWFYRMKIATAGDLDALMDESAYKDYVAGLS